MTTSTGSRFNIGNIFLFLVYASIAAMFAFAACGCATKPETDGRTLITDDEWHVDLTMSSQSDPTHCGPFDPFEFTIQDIQSGKPTVKGEPAWDCVTGQYEVVCLYHVGDIFDIVLTVNPEHATVEAGTCIYIFN